MKDRETLRRHFAIMRSYSVDRFEKAMNLALSDSYNICESQYEQALSATLEPRYIKRVQDKKKEICELWDGYSYMDLAANELEMTDIVRLVSEEMKRAAGIHGERFKDYAEAKEAINEEIQEVWESWEKGDKDHARVEAIQAIGVLIKFIRTVE